MKKLAIAISAAASLGLSSYASAAPYDFTVQKTDATARVELIDILDIAQVTEVDFGTLPHQSGTGLTCFMDPDTVNGDLSGGGGYLHCDQAGLTGTLGIIKISGEPTKLVDVSVGTGLSDKNVTFVPQLKAGHNLVTLDATTGEFDVTVGGTIQMENALKGVASMTYTVTANYQ